MSVEQQLANYKTELIDSLETFKNWLKLTLKWILENWKVQKETLINLCSNHITCLYIKFCEIGTKFSLYYVCYAIVNSQLQLPKILGEIFMNTELSLDELKVYIKNFHSDYLVDKFIKFDDYNKEMFQWYITTTDNKCSVNNKWLEKFKNFFSSYRNKLAHAIKPIDDQKTYITDFIYICPIFLLYIDKYLN